MIEQLIAEHTAALKENTAALRENTAALTGGNTAAPKKGKTAPLAVVADHEPEEGTPEEVATPTPVATKGTKAADTPHVPAKSAPAPGQPDAGEHVDPDEVIASVQATVKAKMLQGDPEKVKTAWTAILKGYGIARVADLRNDPARLLDALAKAKAL